MSKIKNKSKKEMLKCMDCESEKEKSSNFYNTQNKLYENVGKIPICKDCLMKRVKYDDMETIYSILRQFDIKFDIEYWQKSEESKSETFKRYMTMANSLHQFNGTGWKDSNFEVQKVKDKEETINQINRNNVTDELINKWGYGYNKEEYLAFERKYSMLKNNYQEKTAMHTEALLTYIRYRVKEELSTAMNDVKAAKEWGALAQKAAQDAKINPSQLSKSDLSDGLDTFGQLVRTVEQAVDIIPILPQFKEKPQDKVDFTIWCYVNYIRDLKGLPLADYKDIYNFYEQRKQEYADRLKENEEDL